MRSLAAVSVGATGLGLLLAGPSVTPWAFAIGGGLVAGLVLLRRAARPDVVARALAALLATAVVILTPYDGGAYLLPAALTSLVLEMRPVEGAGERRSDPRDGPSPEPPEERDG